MAVIFIPCSLSSLRRFLAASSPILAPACLMNSANTMLGAMRPFRSSFSKKSLVFVFACGVGGNSKVKSRRVSAMLVNASFSGFGRVGL